MTERLSAAQRSSRERKLAIRIVVCIIVIAITSLAWAGISLKDLLAVVNF